MTDLTRRRFVAGAAGLGLALVGPRRLAAETADGCLYANCVMTTADRYAVAVFDERGSVRAVHALPGRGHDVAFDPVAGRVVAFARRPGTFAVAFTVAGEREPEVIAAAPGRHFFGHGVFSADGAMLYATENDFAAGRGVIGIYDARDGYRRIGEIETGGVGTHELVWTADRRTFAIANGGVDTTPVAGGRTDLNRADMDASLTLVDAASGRLLARHTLGPALSQLSIRHLAVDVRGDLWFGCQHYGDPTELPPLAGRLVPGREPELFALPEDLAPRAKNYVGSVAVTADGGAAVFSAPKGGLLFAFAAGSGGFLGTAAFDDGCGVAPAPDGAGDVFVTGGTGRVGCWSPGGADADAIARAPMAFDNHLVRLA